LEGEDYAQQQENRPDYQQSGFSSVRASDVEVVRFKTAVKPSRPFQLPTKASPN
jgi:hypothetical protein